MLNASRGVRPLRLHLMLFGRSIKIQLSLSKSLGSSIIYSLHLGITLLYILYQCKGPLLYTLFLFLSGEPQTGMT